MSNISLARGFTLIEMMIAVAIIGVLATIAIPAYQDYAKAAQIKRVHAELSAYRNAVEEKLSEGEVALSSEDIGYVRSSLVANGPDSVVSLDASGSVVIEVALGGQASSDLAGTRVSLTRRAEGGWDCLIDPSAASGWKDVYRPEGCSL